MEYTGYMASSFSPLFPSPVSKDLELTGKGILIEDFL